MIDIATDELITFHDLRRKFDRDYDTIVKWHKEKGLEAIKVGGTWFTTWDAVKRWLRGEQESRTRALKTNRRHQQALSDARTLGLDI